MAQKIFAIPVNSMLDKQNYLKFYLDNTSLLCQTFGSFYGMHDTNPAILQDG